MFSVSNHWHTTEYQSWGNSTNLRRRQYTHNCIVLSSYTSKNHIVIINKVSAFTKTQTTYVVPLFDIWFIFCCLALESWMGPQNNWECYDFKMCSNGFIVGYKPFSWVVLYKSTLLLFWFKSHICKLDINPVHNSAIISASLINCILGSMQSIFLPTSAG